MTQPLRPILVLLLCLSTWASAALAAPMPGQVVDVTSKAQHQVQLLEDNTAGLEARLQLIENAREYIVLETYIYGLHVSGEWILQALVNKKKQNPNIHIRILVDSIPFVKTLDAFHAQELLSQGIELRLYNPAAPIELMELNYRNHRKLLATENGAIVGGRNIADDYFTLAAQKNFMDRDILIRGPVQKEMLSSFEAFWSSPHAEKLKEVTFPNMDDYRSADRKRAYEYSLPNRLDDPNDVAEYQKAVAEWNTRTLYAKRFCHSEYATPENQALRERVRAAGQRALVTQPVFSVSHIRFVSDGPLGPHSSETMTGPVMLDQIRSTQKSLVIENGYIIPDEDSWPIYKSLMSSGKEISILTNSRKASGREIIVNALTQEHGKTFTEHGGRIYLYSGVLMATDENPAPERVRDSTFATHAKSYVIDGHKCMVGTPNFDPRSLRRTNAELAVFIDDRNFCQHLTSMIRARAGYADLMKADGKLASAATSNDVVTTPQRLVVLLLPVIRLFERWF